MPCRDVGWRRCRKIFSHFLIHTFQTVTVLHSSASSFKVSSVGEMCVNVARHTSHVTRHTSHVTCHTSHVTRHTPHVTRHTSHVTCHTSHVTRHTSHATRHTLRVTLLTLPSAHHPPPSARAKPCTSRATPRPPARATTVTALPRMVQRRTGRGESPGLVRPGVVVRFRGSGEV